MGYKLPNEITEILQKFQKANFQIYIVGGAVRDLLMGEEVTDWDFTTDAKPEEILKLFPNGFYDNKFGTVGVLIKDKTGGGERAFGSEVFDSEAQTRGAQARRGAPVSARNEVRTSTGVASRQDPREQQQIIEITTMRKEGNYRDHRHPGQVSWTNKIEEDLGRRDFTVNAMAFKMDNGQWTMDKKDHSQLSILNYQLVDPFHGQDDLKTKLIRAVGDPTQRFQEDALRLIRAIRLSAELEFEIEKNTLKAIQENAQLIKDISYERILDELFKILASMNPRLPSGTAYIGMVKLREAGILKIILPELERCFGVVQEGPKHDRVYDIGEHSLLSLKHCPSKDQLVRLAALLHDIGKPDTFTQDQASNVTFYNHDVVGGNLVLDIAKRFNLSKKQTDKLFKLVRWHMFTVSEHQTDSAIRRFIRNVGLENIDDMMDLRIGDRLGGGTEKEISWRMAEFRKRIDEVLKKPFSITDLKVNGHDVIEVLGIKPGPKVGEVLIKLFEEVLEDSSKNNRDYLIERIKQIG